jgi:outer membrane immunogenic protein
MRRVICALLLGLAFAPSAFAGDLDLWRTLQPVGPGTFYNWSGFYVGGMVGYAAGNADFSKSTSPILGYIFRDTTLQEDFQPASWPVLGTATGSAMTFGGFAGYNTQWQDLILGIEGTYNQTKLSLVAPSSPIARSLPADASGDTWNVVFTGTGSLSDLQYGTLRFRAGLDLGHFMPYGFAGVAVGQADITVSATGYAEANPPATGACNAYSTPACYFIAIDQANHQNSFVYGFSVGGGVDVALTQNLFLRGEVEYDQFVPIDNILISIVSGRVGAGIKF